MAERKSLLERMKNNSCSPVGWRHMVLQSGVYKITMLGCRGCDESETRQMNNSMRALEQR